MTTVREFVQANIISISLTLAILVGVGALFLWAGSGEESEYPITQQIMEATNFKGVELTPRAKSNCTASIYISFNKDGTGAILSGKDLEISGLYVREIRHELKDQNLYAPEFWEQLVEEGRQYNTIFVIDSTK